MAMKLTTGKVPFPIEFDNGDKQTIYFNPQSKTFWEKIEKFAESMDERFKRINIDKHKDIFDDGIEIRVDMTDFNAMMSLSKEQLDSLVKKTKAIDEIEDEYQNAIKAELDDIFESPVSTIVFKYARPFDDVFYTDENGEIKSEPYIMQFFQALYAEAVKYANIHSEAMQKYIGKYKK